jgi:hypothetical protein
MSEISENSNLAVKGIGRDLSMGGEDEGEERSIYRWMGACTELVGLICSFHCNLGP